MTLFILCLLIMSFESVTPQFPKNNCYSYYFRDFWEVCGGCGLCQKLYFGRYKTKQCDYTYMEQIFIPESEKFCKITDHCKKTTIQVGCSKDQCVPMLGTYKCVCSATNFGRLCQYKVKPGMTINRFAVLENFLYTPYFTLNEYLTISLMFSSLGKKEEVNIVIETLMERLTYDWKACKKIDVSLVNQYCKSLFNYNKKFCTDSLFRYKNVKWVFSAKVPFPGRSFDVKERKLVPEGNGTGNLASNFIGNLEPVKLAIYNKRDPNPLFEETFTAVDIGLSPRFSNCEPMVIITEGGDTEFSLIKLPNSKEIVIETLYKMTHWEKECISRIEDLFIEWVLWIYDINHSEIDGNYFMKKLQVQFIEFKRYSFEPGLYKVRSNVTIWHNQKEGFSTAYSYLEVVLVELEPIVQGGYSRSLYYKHPKIVLNGSMSRNPNLSLSKEANDLLFYWKCDKNLKISTEKNLENDHMTYYGPFLENEIYTFTLTIKSKKYNLQKSASQKICMVPDPSPTLEIICRKNCIGSELKSNPAESTYLEVLIVDITFDIKTNSQFNWVYRSEKEENFKSTDNIKLLNTPDNVLIILENTLMEGESYLFQVKGGSNNPGEAIFKLKMAPSIEKFSCGIKPQYFFKGIFHANRITCDRLLFDNLSPTYEYYDRDPNIADDKGRLLGSKKSNVFKQVAFVRGKLVVEVINQYGIMAAAELNLDPEPDDDLNMVVQNLVEDLEFYHTSMDSNYKANIISAVIDIIYYEEKRFPRANDIIENLLVIVSMDTINSFTMMKVWALAMDILVTKGAKIVFKPESVSHLSLIIMKLSERFKFYLKSSENVFYDFTSREIFEIAQSMINICDKIFSSESKGFEEKFYSIYKESTESTFHAMEMITTSLRKRSLPFMPPYDIKGKSIRIWMKEDIPLSFYELSHNITLNESIPSVVVSKSLAHFLNHWSNFVTAQVIIFDENPFWWSKKLFRPISTNVVDLKFSIKTGGDDEYITKLHYPVQINLEYRDLEIKIINGVVKQPVHDSIGTEELEVPTHKIRVEEQGRLKLHFFGLKKGEELKVLVLHNLRPDYNLIMKKGQSVTQSAPEYQQVLQDPTSKNVYDLYYLSILASHLHAGEYMNYSFEITILKCVRWHHHGWTTRGCKVKDIIPDIKQLQCECEHLSSFAGFAGVPINIVDPFNDYLLLLTVLDNPFVAVVVFCILIIYFIILFYTIRKDHKDKFKQCAIYLEDNLPFDNHPYLVCVQTGARLFSGTTSNVGISFAGENSASRSHILKSRQFKALERANDNWFIMFTPHYLGEIKLLHIWIDFSGNRPEWFCNKIVVIDLKNNKAYTFLINSWLSLRWNDCIEKFEKTATLEESYREDLASDNFIYGFREAHLWMSIISKHPRSIISRSQRLSLAFCGLFAAILASCMFYDDDENLEDYPEYRIAEKEFIVSVSSLAISILITNTVLSVFRKQLIIFNPDNVPVVEDGEAEKVVEKSPVKPYGGKVIGEKPVSARKRGRTFFRFVHVFLRVMVSRKKFVPVHLEIDVFRKDKKRPLAKLIIDTLAWIFCLFIIAFSAFLVILYGLKFGEIKSLEWLSSTIMSIGEEIFVISPMKIIILTVISGILFANIYIVNRYDMNYNMLLTYKNHLFHTKEDMFSKLYVLRGKPIYVPLNYNELAKLKEKQWKKDAFWVLLDFIIIGLLTILLIIEIGTLWSSKYYWNNHQFKALLQKSYKEEGFQLHELKNITNYLPFLEKNILPLIHQLKWYNGLPIRGEKNFTEVSQKFALSSTSCLLGLPRLRQRRQQPGLCQKNRFSGLPDLCPYSGSLTEKTEDTEMYVEGWKSGPFEKFVSLSPWSYVEPTESFDIVAFGYTRLTYGGGGYIADLGLTLPESEGIVTYINGEMWLDKLTSMVFFEMTLYNPNSGTLSVLIVVTEHLYIGLVMNRLFVYTVSQEYKPPAIDLVVLASMLSFIIRVILVFNRHGFKNIVISFWNIFELVIVCLSIYCAFLYIKHIKNMKDHLEKYWNRDREEYFHFIHLITDLTYIQVVMVVLVIMIACRFMKCLKFGDITFYTVFSGWDTLLWISILIIVTVVYWSTICYFLNNFLLSRTFLIVLHKLDFKHTVKNCVHISCKVSLYILCVIAEFFTLLIIMHYTYIYKKISSKRRKEGVLGIWTILSERKSYSRRRS